jgi:hypothetical protein
MDLAARRVFRLALTVSLALAAGYAFVDDLPYMAPLLAFMLTAPPKPPTGPKGLLGLLLLVSFTLGVGLLIVPLLLNYPVAALMLVLVGLFISNYLGLNLGKGPVATFLTMGITMISAAGLAGFQVATTVIDALVMGITIGVICQWLVYPWFPEDDVAPPAQSVSEPLTSSWIALRTSIIVFPTYLMALANPSVYLPIIMKAVSLGQQVSETSARQAGLQLLGSTFMGGLFAVAFWFGWSHC